MKTTWQRWALIGGLIAGCCGPVFSQTKPIPPPAPEKGQRIFSCAHSFAWYVPPILQDMAERAGIQGHEIVGVSKLGGSRVIQHWDVPAAQNQAKEALLAGKVDVLTLSCMGTMDEGVEKFASFALSYNPDVRVILQESWVPWDKLEWPFKGDPNAINQDAATPEFLEQLHAPVFKSINESVVELNQKLGRQVVFVVPVGQAVVMLREKIIAGEIPSIPRQSDLFADKLGHPKAVIEALASYCYFAVIYHRSPVGLPLPQILQDPQHPEWNEALNGQLQEIAWTCVTAHPLSGLHLKSITVQPVEER